MSPASPGKDNSLHLRRKDTGDNPPPVASLSFCLHEWSSLEVIDGLQIVSTLLNKPYDAFADEGAEEDVQVEVKKSKQTNHIHIRIQQRNGRKTITTLQGVPSEYDPKKLLKAFKKEFACNGSIVDDEEMGKVIQLQGDQRQKILEILIEEGIEKETIKMHGF